MDRRSFIKKGCMACAGLSFLSVIVQSCQGVKYVGGELGESGMNVPMNAFDTKQGHRQYVIVRNDELQFPICVYRISDTEYSALLMRCSHQGAELQVAGDQLVCPAHGSEFDKMGKVTQSPAMADLRKFPVTIKSDQLFIDLRKEA